MTCIRALRQDIGGHLLEYCWVWQSANLRLRYRQKTRFCAYITRHFVCISDRHCEHAQQQAQAKDTAYRHILIPEVAVRFNTGLRNTQHVSLFHPNSSTNDMIRWFRVMTRQVSVLATNSLGWVQEIRPKRVQREMPQTSFFSLSMIAISLRPFYTLRFFCLL